MIGLFIEASPWPGQRLASKGQPGPLPQVKSPFTQDNHERTCSRLKASSDVKQGAGPEHRRAAKTPKPSEQLPLGVLKCLDVLIAIRCALLSLKSSHGAELKRSELVQHGHCAAHESGVGSNDELGSMF